MPKSKTVRFYLKTNNDEFRRLLWFQNPKPNDMLMGIYGLTGKSAKLTGIWPKSFVKVTGRHEVKINYSEMEKQDIPLDHISIHSNGRFHLKTRERKSLYVHKYQLPKPLSPTSEPFLYFIAITDKILSYQQTAKKVKPPHMWSQFQPERVVVVKGIFAGSKYKLNLVKQAPPGFSGAHILSSGTIQGYLNSQPWIVSDDQWSNRPPGTIISFRFPTKGNRWIIRTFAFE